MVTYSVQSRLTAENLKLLRVHTTLTDGVIGHHFEPWPLATSGQTSRNMRLDYSGSRLVSKLPASATMGSRPVKEALSPSESKRHPMKRPKPDRP